MHVPDDLFDERKTMAQVKATEAKAKGYAIHEVEYWRGYFKALEDLERRFAVRHDGIEMTIRIGVKE